jgi:hypothetical protein
MHVERPYLAPFLSQPTMDVRGLESVLRAHLAVATICGAYKHPGQTFVRAPGTIIGATFVLVALPGL